MFNFITNLWQNAHPIIVHFPIALLVVSFGLGIMARSKPDWLQASWLTFVIGALATIPATITGIIAHAPYEGSSVYEQIEVHQFLGMITTLIFIGLLIWRGSGMRKGNDIGATWPFIGTMFLGILFLTVTADNGGELVYELGVNVRGINPLLQ